MESKIIAEVVGERKDWKGEKSNCSESHPRLTWISDLDPYRYYKDPIVKM